MSNHIVDDGAAALGVRDITGHGPGRAALAPDLACRCLGSLAIHIRDDDVGTLCRKTAADGAADATCGTGNNNDFVLEAYV